MARPKSPEKNMRSFTCYLDERDLNRAKKVAKRELSNQSAIVRRAIHLGLEILEAKS
jgi:hypothetical protein